MTIENAELTTEQVLRRDIPWETYLTTKLISGTDLQLLRRYDKMAESYKSQLLDDDGPAYVHVFVAILREIFKEETVEYVLALIDEMLTANPRRARLFHDSSFSNEDTYEPFLRLLWKGYWFIQEKSCKILSLIVSARPNVQNVVDASNSKRTLTTMEDVLNGLVEWLCTQLRKPSHPSCSIPSAINCLATLLKEPLVRRSFVQADGVKLLVPLISPASTQQSIQLIIVDKKFNASIFDPPAIHGPNYNNIFSVIPQVGSEEGRVYVDCTPILGGREVDPQLKEKHIKADRKRNNGSEEIMAKYYKEHDKASWKKGTVTTT